MHSFSEVWTDSLHVLKFKKSLLSKSLRKDLNIVFLLPKWSSRLTDVKYFFTTKSYPWPKAVGLIGYSYPSTNFELAIIEKLNSEFKFWISERCNGTSSYRGQHITLWRFDLGERTLECDTWFRVEGHKSVTLGFGLKDIRVWHFSMLISVLVLNFTWQSVTL